MKNLILMTTEINNLLTKNKETILNMDANCLKEKIKSSKTGLELLMCQNYIADSVKEKCFQSLSKKELSSMIEKLDNQIKELNSIGESGKYTHIEEYEMDDIIIENCNKLMQKLKTKLN